jgi:hypothetical protein
LHEYVNTPPDDEIEQQLFVHTKPPPRQSGHTDIENDEPLRMELASITTGHTIWSSVGEI